jgi:hypothetical protein
LFPLLLSKDGGTRTGTEPFNIFNAYAYQAEGYTARDGGAKYMSQAALENATRVMAPVTEKDLIERVRDYRISDDEAGYGQVVSLHADMDPDLIRIWVAPTSSVTASFNPWWLGVKSVLPEYGLHRYLYKDAASTFLDTDYQFQEATHFAGRIFKQVLYYTCSDPESYLPIVQNMLHGFENASFADLEWVERSAQHWSTMDSEKMHSIFSLSTRIRERRKRSHSGRR